MSPTYRPAPPMLHSDREALTSHYGQHVSLTACGPTWSRQPEWMVLHFSDDRRVVERPVCFPWTAAGERAARAEYARLAATITPAVEAEPLMVGCSHCGGSGMGWHGENSTCRTCKGAGEVVSQVSL